METRSRTSKGTDSAKRQRKDVGAQPASIRRPGEPIAVVGMACRFPGGADTPDRFWEILRDGVDTITPVPPDRWDVEAFYDPDLETPGKMVMRHGAFVDRIHDIDAHFFGVSGHVAAEMDPQQKLLLETTWRAIEDSGLTPPQISGSNTSVYVGLWSIDYWHELMSVEPADLGPHTGVNLHSQASANLSAIFNLKGTSVSLDTACSASLVTIHLACQSLRLHESDMAFAGGVNAIISPKTSILLSKKQVLAPDGRCKVFDAKADGFVRGEGCGMVILKRLADAQRDGDRILAVIRGTAITHDGRDSAPGVPSARAQELAIERALADAGVGPRDVSFVEAHGTGTATGDPIEVAAIGTAYASGRPKGDPLILGSVKTNIGHLETASGVASFIKAVLALEREAIPPNLHFNEPNPRIPWADLPVKVCTTLTPWRRGEHRRLCGVSSFGIGGTNVHIVLEEAPVVPAVVRTATPDRTWHVIAMHAKGKNSLVEIAHRAVRNLEDPKVQNLQLADICYSANRASIGGALFRDRLSIVAETKADLRAKLAAFADGKVVPGVVQGQTAKTTNDPTFAFLFTGQGSQYVGMGRTLYETQPTFRKVIDDCDRILATLDVPLVRTLYPADGEGSPLHETRYTQPALFAIEYALAQLFESWGISPSFVMGHSVGEYVAACVAGVFSLEDALRLVAERGRLMQALPKDGRMEVVLADAERVRRAIGERSADVGFAAINGPANTVISGRSSAVAEVVAALNADGIETKPLKVSHAFHSPLMEPMLADFERVASTVSYSAPVIPLISNLTGDCASDELLSPEYWVQHVRQPVNFEAGIHAAHQAGVQIFLELGPKPALTGMGRQCLPGAKVTWVSTLREGQDDWLGMLTALSEMFVSGVAIDWVAYDRDYVRARVPLPGYPLRPETYTVNLAARRKAPAVTTAAPGGTSLRALLESGDGLSQIEEDFAGGAYTPDELTLLRKLLGVFVEEHRRRRQTERGVVGEYYDSLTTSIIFGEGEETAPLDVKPILNFAPFPEPVSDFSWIVALNAPQDHPEHVQMIFNAQKETRAVLFRHVDAWSMRRVMDFGCGYSSDLISLAEQYPHLQLNGFTISPKQAETGQREAARRGLQQRVHIFNKDSSKDEFPKNNDLVIGFEVACHIKNKRALFGNVSRSLVDGGRVLLADFISHAEFEIAHDETSSYLITTAEWAEVLTMHNLQAIDCVDISQEIANFFEDPTFDDALEKARRVNAFESVRAAFHSYSRLGKMLKDGMTSYVLFSIQKRSDVPKSELYRLNEAALTNLVPYPNAYPNESVYETEWHAQPRSRRLDDAAARNLWLILGDRGGQAEKLAEEIEQRGGQCAIVLAGDRYDGEGGRWTIDPRDGAQFQRVVTDVATHYGRGIERIVHMWSLDTPAAMTSVEALDLALNVSCGVVLKIAQADENWPGGAAPRCWLVTRGAVPAGSGSGPRSIAQSPLWGLGRVFSQEHPALWGGLIDLDPERNTPAVDVLAEILDSDGEDHIAHRAEGRYVARLVRARRQAPQDPVLRPDATYLVTGGLGSLGLQTARWMVERGARNLLLTSRRLPEKRPSEVAHMESLGATVQLVQGDVANEADLRRILGTINAAAPLRGIVHAAGVSTYQEIDQLKWDDFAAVVRPKVMGGWLLHELTRDKKLDFFVSFSSIASVWGSKGGGHYAAANHFLDALAHMRQSLSLPALSINWGPWAGGGMATPEALALLAKTGLRALEPKLALESLGYLISAGSVNTTVAHVDWNVFRETYELRGRRPLIDLLSTRSREKAGVQAAAATTDILEQIFDADSGRQVEALTEYVHRQAAAVLGFDDVSRIDRDVSLVELGFDSLMAVQLRNLVRKDLKVDLPLGKLFESASIDDLGVLLHERVSASTLVARSAAPAGTATAVEVL